jgi:hypothetical protein
MKKLISRIIHWACAEEIEAHKKEVALLKLEVLFLKNPPIV